MNVFWPIYLVRLVTQTVSCGALDFNFTRRLMWQINFV